MSSLHHRNNNHHKQSKKSGFKHFYTPPKLTTANLASLAVQTNHHGLPSSSLSPLRCKYCSKLFAKFTTLRKHEMLHQLNGNYTQILPRNNSETEISEVNNTSESASKSTALTLTPSLLSNLNKLANLKSECNDGKKPAILININTNDTPQTETAKMKSQEMPLNSSSGLMISSVSSVDKNYFETIEKQKDSSGATVFIQNGKKAVSLAELQCPICKKIVSQPFSLKVHLRTHTMEK
jgi:phage FluMu protein Com